MKLRQALATNWWVPILGSSSDAGSLPRRTVQAIALKLPRLGLENNEDFIGKYRIS
jgi:hypothetical protein